MISETTKQWLIRYANEFNGIDFIESDPISIPHRFSLKQDIEISGLFAAIFAWGQRRTIIGKASELMERMDGSPYAFITGFSERELAHLKRFVHRTFNDVDLEGMVWFLRDWYRENSSLETAFYKEEYALDLDVGRMIDRFRGLALGHEKVLVRTGKHLPSPAGGSASKRLCMYLRWMVREDESGVDFGIWKKISASQLVLPMDVHVGRTSVMLNLLEKEKSSYSWADAVNLTRKMKAVFPDDPVLADFALFAFGVFGGE